MINPAWLKIAIAEIGQKEIWGYTNNPRILEYHKETTLKATNDETPWCSAFVNWVMRQAGYKTAGSAAALSWLAYGRKLRHPCYGSIVVYDHGNGRGHVGFVLGYATKNDIPYLAVLGGNQSNQVKVSLFKGGTAAGYCVPADYQVPIDGYKLPLWSDDTQIETETR